MKRLLFAAARGARIQVRSKADHPHWWITLRFDRTQHEYRIHPADEHLQYGPISTELREAAELVKDSSYLQDVLGRYGCAAVDDYVGNNDEFGPYWDTAMRASVSKKQLFLLLLSESLADDGL